MIQKNNILVCIRKQTTIIIRSDIWALERLIFNIQLTSRSQKLVQTMEIFGMFEVECNLLRKPQCLSFVYRAHLKYKYSLLMHCIKIKSPAKFLLNEQYVFVGGNISFFCVCYHVVPKRHSQLDYELNGL